MCHRLLKILGVEIVPSLLVIFEDLWKIGEIVAALSCPDVHKEGGNGSPYPCMPFLIPPPPAENFRTDDPLR